MTAVIDTLKIVLEADASGLETQLKRGMTTIQQFVGSANSQSLDWQKILAGSLDTAIISGIAATFAIAIEQAVQFQSSLLNLNNSAAGTASALDSSTGNISDSMVSLAGKTGASLGDTTAAYESLFKQISDPAGAQKLTEQIGLIASELGTNLATLMPEVISLFNQWGITTLPAAESALTGLVEAAGQGKFSFSELLDTISAQGPILQSKTNVSDLALQLQALSNVSTLSKGTILNDFSAIANSVANPLSQMNLLAGTGRAFNGPDGLITAMQKLNGFLSQAGGTAQTFGQQFGLSASAVSQDARTSASALEGAKTATDDMRKGLSDLDAYIAAHESTQTRFQVAWQGFLADLAKPIGIPVLETLTNDLEEIDHLLSSKNILDFFQNIFSDAGNSFTSGLNKVLQPVLNSGGNAPSSNGNQKNMGNVTLNTTVNVNGQANGAPSSQILGSSIATGLYNAFQGLLSKI